jgi:hypothetical protein
MNILTLKVPNSQQAKDWLNFIVKNSQDTTGIDLLIVDFNIVKFLDTDDIVLLACLIEAYYLNGSKIKFVGGLTQFVKHLENIKFQDYWNDGFDRSEFTFSKNKTTICLWKISKEKLSSYTQYAKQYYEQYFEFKNINKDLLPISSNIDEVFNNIFDHSKSKIDGYIITQYFPQSNIISFSVCDFGIGIPKSFQESSDKKLNQLDDPEALKKSLESGVSIKSTPRNRGFGLNNISDLVHNSNGELAIISNSGILFKEQNKEIIVKKIPLNFQGTLIKVQINLDYLTEKETDEEVFGL